MQKKSWILLTFVLFIGFVSSQLSDFLIEVNANDWFLVLILVVSFALINMSLSRVFKDNRTTSTTIALASSMGIVYGMNKVFDIEGLFSYTGISNEVLSVVVPILLLAAVVILSKVIGFGETLIVFGAFSIFADIADIFDGLLVLGIILLVIGVFLIFMKHRGGGSGGGEGRREYRDKRRARKHDTKGEKRKQRYLRRNNRTGQRYKRRDEKRSQRHKGRNKRRKRKFKSRQEGTFNDRSLHERLKDGTFNEKSRHKERLRKGTLRDRKGDRKLRGRQSKWDYKLGRYKTGQGTKTMLGEQATQRQTIRQSGMTTRQNRRQTGLDTRQNRRQTGLDTRQNRRQSGMTTRQNRRQTGLDTRQNRRQSGMTTRQNRRQTGLDTRQNRRQTGLDTRQNRRQSGMTTRQNRRQTGLDTRQNRRQTGLDTRQNRRQTGLDTRQNNKEDRREVRRPERTAERTARGQKPIVRIGSNINSLIKTYNQIQKQNPTDPRLIQIKEEILRLRREGKKNRTPPRGQNNKEDRREVRRPERTAERTARGQKPIVRIGSNINSLIKTYNQIQKQNPTDPRLIQIKEEILRLRREGKKNRTPPRGQNNKEDRREVRRPERTAERTARGQKPIVRIGSNINSLIKTYNQIQKQNPTDPRLIQIKEEILRLRREGKKNRTPPRGQNNKEDRREVRRPERTAERTARGQKPIVRIGSNINSLIKTYNQIQKQNPTDPRLIQIKEEILRLRREGKKNRTPPRGQNNKEDRREVRRPERTAERTARGQKPIVRIGSNINSLIKTYNQIQKQNPTDPRLIQIKEEILRLRREGKKNRTPPRGQNNKEDRREVRRPERTAERTARGQKPIVRIGSNINSLIKTYNQIQKQNPTDPRLIQIKEEILRLRREGKKNRTPPRGQNNKEDRREVRRPERTAERTARGQKPIVRIGSNINSLIKTYNQIQKQNPTDPRLIQIKEEILRLRREGKKNRTPPRGQNNKEDRREVRRPERTAERTARGQKPIVRIGSNINSLIKTYNQIQKQNPTDPRLIQIKEEILRLRREGKKNRTPPRGQNNKEDRP